MSTADVLAYTADFGPDFVEWINDTSCNVVFRTPALARRALENLSLAVDDINALLAVQAAGGDVHGDAAAAAAGGGGGAAKEETQLPPGVTPIRFDLNEADPDFPNPWRQGLPVPGRANIIYMRFATQGDVKPQVSKPSLFYKKMRAMKRGKGKGKGNRRRAGKNSLQRQGHAKMDI